MSFTELGLSPALLRALETQGYTTPTEIQQQSIPVALAGRDLLAGAQTGTGKTAAFSLPMLERLFPGGKRPQNAQHAPQSHGRGPGKIRALVLTPTRELAAQVHESVRAYGAEVGVRTAQVFGGVSMGPQFDVLRRGLDVLIATPGRLIDHLDRRSADLSQVEILVLDEADRMLDMGFLPALKRILNQLPKARQTLMFSATFADPIKALAMDFLREPEQIQIAQRNSVASTVQHIVHPVDAAKKRDLLVDVLRAQAGQTLVFSRTKHGSDKLVKILEQANFKAAAIHGNKSQNARTRALEDFKRGRINVLVATDIAARGIDIDQLPCVVNFDLPMVAEDYIHRIGRTGRAGSEGQAISLVSADEAYYLRDIQRLLKREIELVTVAGYECAPLRIDTARKPPGPQRQGQRSTNHVGQRPSPQKHARRPHAPSGAPKHAAGNRRPARGGGGADRQAGNRRPSGRAVRPKKKPPSRSAFSFALPVDQKIGADQ